MRGTRQGLVDGVRDRLVREDGQRDGRALDDEQLAQALRASGRVLGTTALRELTRTARAELYGAGPLQVLLDEPGVTDVLVNGPDEVWVDRGAGVERADVRLGGPDDVRALAVRLAAAGGQRLDDAAPVVDARLPDGTRLHALVAPVCEAGAVISLRVLRPHAFDLAALVRAGTVPPAWEGVLRELVARRASVLVSGGTGTGKTTLLAALLALVPGDERVVCVEEARELAPDHPHVVPLTARRPNVEGAGGVDLADLVRAALRMRPDRIVLGECRGAEVREVLMALNTGHEGGLATIHANDVEVVPARLEALAALAGMDRAAVAAQAVGGLDVVLHLRRARRGTTTRRHLAQIGLVRTGERGALRVDVAATWGGAGVPVAGPAHDAFARRWSLPGRAG
ncbi:TadA family conjugal transfer-associated ATPase [Cellulosimicrobium arenosum]|uniref:TadA family conjugal transfer-associated ATPase n=1 Tax=Cellulosimicrobium arenosum TaxID=2708133 RepID=A0A927G9E7_9MICO|nr:TadA family conjugal transfer-associated ATPase [Cellulosimicrobium arenosum]MBD8078882.1 TadA family conjugal transfer-associated ATPase [Cellulosimicrobium arenosum]